MRIVLAFALLAAASAARAADLPIGPSGALGYGQRSEMVWFYDDQPGVVVRDYWSTPWHNHHYYPYTGIKPRVGRYENLSAVSHPRPAQSYHRNWSNDWAYAHSPVMAEIFGGGNVTANVDVQGYQNDVHPRRHPHTPGHHQPDQH